MKPGARGLTNEHRTIDFLAERGWVALRAGASKGMLDSDVIAYNIKDGRVKHIQAKSNHHYTKKDIEALEMVRHIVTAPNVSIELWDWQNRSQYPTITIISGNGDHLKYSMIPELNPIGELK